MFTGPDVSEHQGDVDWKRVAADHELAVVRVSDGDHRDPFYTEGRVKAARDAGLLLAPYYFARVASPQNNERDGAAEAKMVLGFAKSRGWRWPGDLPLIYDFETSNAQPNTKCARHIVQFVRAYRKSEDHYPGVYTMPGFWDQIVPHLSKDDRRELARCFLHQAEWDVEQPRPLDPWDGAALWQYTDSGSCPGVKGGVDMNRSLISEQQILALAKSEREPERERRAAEEPTEPDPEPGRPAEVPRWVPSQYWPLWQKPWDGGAAKSAKFRELCWEHGYASPHFDRKETACHDAQTSPVPAKLRQRPARGLRLGAAAPRARRPAASDPQLVSDARAQQRGRRRHSDRHMQADAADFTVQTVEGFGPGGFDSACEKVFANGGFGRYPSGSRHGDTRGSRARW